MTHNYVIPPEQLKAWAPLLESKGAKRVMNRVRPSKGVPVFPDVVSDHRQTLSMMEELASELTSAHPTEHNADGTVGPNAVAGDFYALLTVAGHGMNPISVPPVDNAWIRKNLGGLKEEFTSARHAKIFDELCRVMFATKVPAKVSIRREASTGSPDYVNFVDYKKAALRKALTNLEHYLKLVESDDLLGLYIEYNSPIVQTTGERTQADKVLLMDGAFVSKGREVNDEAAARSGDLSSRRDADKTVYVDGVPVKGHFAGRRRTVFGMSFVPNYVVASVFSTMRAHYLQRYAFTWKHRTPESILEKMKMYRYMAGFDVKQFDQSVPFFMVDRFCTNLESYVHKSIAKLIRLMFQAPYIVPYPWIAGTSEQPFNPLFGDDPFEVTSFKFKLGLPSGISCNPDFGKLVMMAQYLALADDYFHDVLEVGVEAILTGEHSKYGFLNMGDDCVVMTNDEGFHKHVTGGEYKAEYFSVEPEVPISFLGNVPYRTEQGELKLAPNIASFFVNWLVPEHGIDHHSRRNFWAVGDRERRQHYAKAPAYSSAYQIYEEIFSKHIGRTPSSFTTEHYDAQRKLAGLSYIDALVLQNPAYLAYRYDEDDVSPEIMDILVTSLSADEVWPLIKPFI